MKPMDIIEHTIGAIARFPKDLEFNRQKHSYEDREAASVYAENKLTGSSIMVSVNKKSLKVKVVTYNSSGNPFTLDLTPTEYFALDVIDRFVIAQRVGHKYNGLSKKTEEGNDFAQG